MIIKVNTNGIILDFTGNPELENVYKSPCIAIPRAAIDKIDFEAPHKLDSNQTKEIHIVDNRDSEYVFHYDQVTDINGTTTFANAKAVFDAITFGLLGI